MYARKAAGRELTFDFAEGLLRDNLLFVDRETNSVWSQLRGGAVNGPLQGTPLRIIPSMQTTWKFWREQHPGTQVLLAKEEGRSYLYRNRPPGSNSTRQSAGHDTSALGLGLAVGGEAVFFPFRELERSATPLTVTLGGQPVTVHYRKEALTAWAEDAQGNLLPGVLAYEQGWKGFNPDSETYQAGGS